MAKIKLLSNVSLVRSQHTIQGEAEIDGEIVLFRYMEYANGSENYIYDTVAGWTDDYDEKYNCLFELCGQQEINQDCMAGSVFDSDEY